MAGGLGTRMGGQEKPMLLLNGRPMISYVLDALTQSERIGRIHLVVSQKTPLTQTYVSDHFYGNGRIGMVITPGAGYIEDTVSAAHILKLAEPFLVIASDLPLVTTSAIDAVVDAYGRCGREALSVHLPADLVDRPDIVLHDTGSATVPAGINVLHGAHMDRPQDEYVLILSDTRLAMNVNYRKDLVLCAKLMNDNIG